MKHFHLLDKMGRKLYMILFVFIVLASQVSSSYGKGCGRKKIQRFLDQNGSENIESNAPGNTPYLVRLSKDQKGHTFFCSGVILSSRYILTAGICTKLADVKIFAVVGDYSTKEKDGESIYEIEDYLVHQNMTNYVNNIALLRTAHPMHFNRFSTDGAYHRIMLADKESLNETGLYYTVAWTHDRDNHGTVQFFPTDITPFSKCYEKYPKLRAEDTICAKVDGPDGGPCSNRDIGAPLIVVLPNNRVRLAGIISEMPADPACESVEDRQITFLNIPQYKKWIVNVPKSSFVSDFVRKVESLEQNRSQD